MQSMMQDSRLAILFLVGLGSHESPPLARALHRRGKQRRDEGGLHHRVWVRKNCLGLADVGPRIEAPMAVSV